MLSIVFGNGSKARATDWKTWHIGERCPNLHHRVITFEADGDELQVIVDAIKAASSGWWVENPLFGPLLKVMSQHDLDQLNNNELLIHYHQWVDKQTSLFDQDKHQRAQNIVDVVQYVSALKDRLRSRKIPF